MDKAPYRITGLLFAGLLISATAVGAATTADLTGGDAAKTTPEKIYVLNDYHYEPGAFVGDNDLGLALCGTRCNAMATDYRNYIEPPGWRIIRIAADKEISVDLNNPFMDGNCICVVDEYVVKANELYMSK